MGVEKPEGAYKGTRVLTLAIALLLACFLFSGEPAHAVEDSSGAASALTLDDAVTSSPVKKLNIEKAKVAGLVTKTYSGKKLGQDPQVKLGSSTLKKGRDYTLSYKNNVNAGTATLVITGKGAYTGKKTVTFQIAPADLSKGRISVKKRMLYTGKAAYPDVVVTWQSKRLTKGKDYAVTFRNNVKVGKNAIATVIGKGNYKGKLSTNFKIVKQPVIGVVETKRSRAAGTIRWLNRCGLLAVWIGSPKMNVNNYDGLVIPGGCDVHPSFYGEKDKKCDSTNPKLDAFQFDIIKRFVAMGKPILGICRGHQVLNVYFGGSLHQDIGGYHKYWHNMKISGDSWLERIYGTSERTYHYHHQAVKKLGTGLVVTARDAEHNFVEGIEHKTLPVWGVQFHPEYMGAAGKKVAKAFDNECRKVLKRATVFPSKAT